MNLEPEIRDLMESETLCWLRSLPRVDIVQPGGDASGGLAQLHRKLGPETLVQLVVDRTTAFRAPPPVRGRPGARRPP